jgi:subtilase family serine protease
LGSGGGFSTTEPQPAYQAGLPGTSAFGAVPYLIPENYQHIGGLIEPTAWGFNPTPDVIHGSGSGRALPDLSADADPYSGYLVYCPSCVAAGYPSPLIGTYGGTSFVAPQLNAATAVIDSYLGRRVGFWNPQIYSFAQGSTSPFTPLDRSGTENDNNYYTGTPGLAYNEGGGLGYPDLFKLAQDFRAEP